MQKIYTVDIFCILKLLSPILLYFNMAYVQNKNIVLSFICFLILIHNYISKVLSKVRTA